MCQELILFQHLLAFVTYIFIVSLLSFIAVYFLHFFRLFIVFPGDGFISSISVLLLVLSSSFIALLIPLMNMLGYSKYFVFFSNLDTWTRLIVVWLILMIFRPSQTGFIFLMTNSVISVSISIFIFMMIYHKLDRPRLTKFHFKIEEIFSYSWPISVATILQWFQSNGWRILVQKLYSFEAVGILSITYNFGAPILTAFHQVLDQIKMPGFYAEYQNFHDNDSRNESWKKYALSMIKIIVVGCLGIVILSPFLMLILSKPRYHSFAIYSSIFVFIELLRIIGSVFQQNYFASKKTYGMIFPFLISSIFTFIMIWFKIWGESLEAVVISLLLGGLIVISVFTVAFWEKITHRTIS